MTIFNQNNKALSPPPTCNSPVSSNLEEIRLLFELKRAGESAQELVLPIEQVVDTALHLAVVNNNLEIIGFVTRYAAVESKITGASPEYEG